MAKGFLLAGAVVAAPLLAVAFLRFPVLLAMLAIAASMLMSEQTITQTGLLGVNVLDALVLAMVPVIVMSWPAVQGRLYRSNAPIAWAIWFVAFVSLGGVLQGAFGGYPPRSVLRDFRFYVYLVVIFHFAATLRQRHHLKWLAIAWGGLGLAQVWLVSRGVLIYNPDEAGVDLLASNVYESLTHFLPIKSLFPMFLAMGILAQAAALGLGMRLLLGLAVLGEVVILLFTYSRSLYIGALGGVLGLVLALAQSRRVTVHRGLTAAGVAALLVVLLVLISGTVLPLFEARGLIDVEAVRQNIEHRFWSAGGTDASIEDRQYGMKRALLTALDNPLLGTGFGTADDYWAATEFHNSYLWMARTIGIPGALAFIGALLLCGLRTMQGMRHSRVEPVVQGLWVGFVGCFAAQLTVALLQPMVTNLVHFVEWGLLLGILSSSGTLGSDDELETGPEGVTSDLHDDRPTDDSMNLSEGPR